MEELKNRWEEILSDIIEELRRWNIKKIILFGSRAKGYYKDRSDIDIAIERDLDFREKRKLKERVDRVSGLCSVDIVFFI